MASQLARSVNRLLRLPAPQRRAARTVASLKRSLLTTQEHTMYDMYPDWGPARNNPDNPMNRERLRQLMQAALDQRDKGSERPDDN